MAERRRRARRSQTEEPLAGQLTQLQAPLKWKSENQVPVLFANQLHVQGSEGQFILVFGIMTLPYEPMSEELRQRLTTQGLPVMPVAKIAVGTEKFGEIVRVLNGVWEQVQAAQATSRG